MEIINVSSKHNPFIDDLNKKSLQELKNLFLLVKYYKISYRNISFEKHIIYYEFSIVSPVALLPWNVPTMEIQEKILLDNIEGFENYIDYEIKPLCLSRSDDSGKSTTYKTPAKYFFKGKFTDEKQFYIFFLTLLH